MSLPEPRHLARLPPATLPWVYLTFAHAALIWALATVVLSPELLTQYFYQPRVIALVHAVTLGWVTCTILGVLYIVGPIALRTPVATSRSDAIGCAAVLVGALGMISHFWIDAYSGMVWSAATLLLGAATVAWRTLPALLRAPVPVAVRTAIGLAFANLLLAGLLGSALGLEKVGAIAVPGQVLSGVWAHAHLAGLGWATMMVLGIGYRLIPMLVPAGMPRGGSMLASVALLQVGVVGLGLGLILESPWSLGFALACAAGVATFVLRMAARLRDTRPTPKGLARPDLALGHTILAICYLVVAAALGILLVWLPVSAITLRLAAVYGVVALLGFLAQLIVGIGGRLMPLTAWMQTYVRSGFVEPDFSQYAILDRRLQAAALAAWVFGVPLLGSGVFQASTGQVRGGASLLLMATLAEAWQRARSWRVGRIRLTSPAEPTASTESPPDS